MARELGRLYVAVRCTECGPHGDGVPTSTNGNRCTECGRFAESATDYCAEHDVDTSSLPRGYTSCPVCEEERRIAAEREHLMTRDVTVEPW